MKLKVFCCSKVYFGDFSDLLVIYIKNGSYFGIASETSNTTSNLGNTLDYYTETIEKLCHS